MPSAFRWGNEAENKSDPIALRGRGAKRSFLTSTRFLLQSWGVGGGGCSARGGAHRLAHQILCGCKCSPGDSSEHLGRRTLGQRIPEAPPQPGTGVEPSKLLPSQASPTCLLLLTHPSPPFCLHPLPAFHASQLDLKIPSSITLQAEIRACPQGGWSGCSSR